ncbi:GNAT family N-acetyltransferase [Kushneria phyllosphaerae]|uniref:Putative N-acetyltransferase YvbK n=1 Tax=Kushneria phyllosphaerae TaxID=2100822 RepID=A0A2R8CLW5_9GAMM|nr:GNAT family N-acetyltransferase [Kushneria phyllosphaerae]SPJ33891.1 putative N-acetyltransferase YvbK [Kushneria phyllosphaerae]
MTKDALVVEKVSVSSLPRHLLLQADPEEAFIEVYPDDGIGLSARLDGEIVGACVLGGSRHHGELELLNIAVMPALQKRGVGTCLLETAINTAREHSYQHLVLGTGTFGYQLSFYQRHGFRVIEVQRDYFTQHYARPLFENGIQHRDRLWLAFDLSTMLGK